MNLGELLDELRTGILHDVSDQISGPSSQLWSDERLIRYINEAQRRFARMSFVLVDDATTEVVDVPLVEGQARYPLHPAVFAVLSARYDTSVSDMTRTGHSMLNSYRRVDVPFTDLSALETLTPGRPEVFATDEAVSADDYGSMTRVTLRVYPTPSEAEDGKTVHLRVVRYPIDALTHSTQIPELPEDHHLEMLDWAAYLALRIVDHDAGDVSRAHEFRRMFETHVLAARNMMVRKLFAPTPWGFGRGGWAWEK